MSDRAIRDTINQITDNLNTVRVYAVDATVSSVDIPARTCVCQVVSGKVSNILSNVRLMASVDDGLIMVPAAGSNVCVILSDSVDPYISQYSAIDSIVMRGGDLGGLIKIIELTSKLNEFVNGFNTELPKIAAGIATGGGFYSPTNANTFSKSDFENDKITHG